MQFYVADVLPLVFVESRTGERYYPTKLHWIKLMKAFAKISNVGNYKFDVELGIRNIIERI